MNKEVVKLGRSIFKALVESKEDIAYKGLTVRVGSYRNTLEYNKEPVLQYDRDDHYLCIYGTDKPIVRKIQNSFLFFFGYKVTKIRNRDESAIRRISDGRLIDEIGNHYHYESTRGVYKYWLTGDLLFGVLNKNTEINGCKVSDKLLLDYNRQRRRSVNIMRDIKLNDDFETVSFLPEMKPNEEKNRQSMKIGKFVKKVYKNQFTDSDIEKFVNFIKSKAPSNYKFKIVEGNEIQEFYHHRRYETPSGSLEGSCMKHSECQGYFKIYTENPDIVKMLVLTNDDNFIIGRALLWSFENRRDGKKYQIMDRIYGADAVIQKFKDWAKENKYWTKEYQSYEEKYSWTKPNGDHLDKFFDIPLNTSFTKFPYIDSFTYVGKGYVTNEYEAGDKGTANRTDGGLEDCETIRECYHSCRDYDEEEMQYCQDIDDYVYEDYAVYCDETGAHVYIENTIILDCGDRVHEDYAYYCNYNDYYVREEDRRICDHSGESYDVNATSVIEIDDVGDVIEEHAKECYEENGFIPNSETGEWEKED